MGRPAHPTREGYTAPVDPEILSLNRDLELIAGAGLLGVQPSNVHIDTDGAPARGTSIDIAGAVDLFRFWADRHPGAGHYTMWWGDPHPDHAALGSALRQLRLAEPETFGDARWLVKPEQATAAAAKQYVVADAILRNTALVMSRRAAYPFRAWTHHEACSPSATTRSAGSYFDDVERGDPNWIVSTPR